MTLAKILAAGATAIALATPAAAQMVLKSYDVNSDGKLTGAEFRGLFNDNPMMADLDTDADGFISEMEYQAAFGDPTILADTTFGSYAYTDWDKDSDGLVASTEFEEGFLTLYDQDESGDIDEAEFTTMQGEVNQVIAR
ncbi:hypothetical protein [Jannaschia sp. W003]|uniref:hypothetical protein n=1 Tax=Jannaschia sp. W003 TaxID=2867012 RepID=UPI0021A59CD3|nr:hypothetical protein [Jannaschia sp. W003]UWQ20400.1 hypothetical protein K3554_10375 [Jannaschia sp. W003]